MSWWGELFSSEAGRASLARDERRARKPPIRCKNEVRGSRRRGFALADFMAGTLILAGAVSAWVAITRAQLDATRHAEQRNRARDAALLALDRARLDGIAGLGSPTGAADKSGFRFLRTFDVAALPKLVSKEPHGRLDARPLPEEGASSSPILEVRATVRWRAERGEEVLELSTALGAADAR